MGRREEGKKERRRKEEEERGRKGRRRQRNGTRREEAYHTLLMHCFYKYRFRTGLHGLTYCVTQNKAHTHKNVPHC